MIIQATVIKKSFSTTLKPVWVVKVDADAAEIMGETRLRYVFATELGAQLFSVDMQQNLQACMEAEMNP